MEIYISVGIKEFKIFSSFVSIKFKDSVRLKYRVFGDTRCYNVLGGVAEVWATACSYPNLFAEQITFK